MFTQDHHRTYASLAIVAVFLVAMAYNGPTDAATMVPGAQKKVASGAYDVDNNGIPDAGIYVNGHYTSLYAYDESGAYYWDLGDGRVQGTVASVDLLDQSTLTVCNYVINYRADFGNDPFMNEGWIQNLIDCKGFDDNGHYNYIIVSQTDPRYTGNPEWALWGTWEFHVLTESHKGNLTGPQNHIP